MTTWQVIVVVFAAVALGLSALALYVAWQTRTVANEARSSIWRHTQEHRTGIEDEGLRRHRAGAPPLTGQIPRSDPLRADPVSGQLQPDTAEHPAPRSLPGLPPPGQIRHPRA